MLKSAKILGVMAFVLLVAGVSFAQTSEKLTITTYYPAPYGVYNELRLYPSWHASQCNSANEGTMYYDNMLMVCDGTSYQSVGWWTATERSSGSNIFDLANKNTGNVSVNLAPWDGWSLPAPPVFSVAGTDSNTGGNAQLRVGAGVPGINLSQKESSHTEVVAGNNSAQVYFIDGAFNFGSLRKNPNLTHKHPWVHFDSTYPAGGGQTYFQPAFELYPPVSGPALTSCDTVCQQKFRTPDPSNANNQRGVFCLGATGSNSYGVDWGSGISCSNSTLGVVHCLCAKLSPYADPASVW